MTNAAETAITVIGWQHAQTLREGLNATVQSNILETVLHAHVGNSRSAHL